MIAWVAIGLPSLVIGYGFGGGEFVAPMDLPSAVSFALVVLFLLSPLLLWRWRKNGRKEGF